MKVPYDGKVNIRLVLKRFAKKVFYYVSDSKSGNFKLEPCILNNASFSKCLFVRPFKDDFTLCDYSHGADWENLYDNYETAEKEVKERNKLFNAFQHMPYVTLKTLKEHEDDLLLIESDICKLLSGFENFDGIDFCDVSANGIQIRGHHKQIKGYTYGSQPTIRYDFSNKDDIVMEFVSMWHTYDRPEKINREKVFIADGEKYGWD